MVLLYRNWSDVHKRLCLCATIELPRSLLIEGDVALCECENGMILSHAYVQTRHEMCTTLSDDNSSCWNHSPAEYLYTKALGLGIATVFRGTTCFFMCHIGKLWGIKQGYCIEER